MNIKGIVAIIGRPNVGKSTIFNRLTRSSKSLVDDCPGVTRDRIYGIAHSSEDGEMGFHVVDTGGFETKDLYFQPFEKNIVWEQTEKAIKEADVVLMVFDAKSGLHPHDHQIANYLKKQDKNVVYVANKVDGIEQRSLIWEFYEVGVSDDILSCSAAHNRGILEVKSALQQRLLAYHEKSAKHIEDPNAIKIALIGRPNAGKSSILNRIAGSERSLVSDVAGTTRDVVDMHMSYNKQSYIFLDTAGIRRRSRINDALESLCVMRSLEALERADVVVVVVSAPEGINDQDARLVSLAISKYKPVLLVVNKWDLIEDKNTQTVKEYQERIYHKLNDASFIPILFTSCETNQRVHRILDQVEALSTLGAKRVQTSELNEVLAQSVKNHTPALIKKYSKRAKFYFATQVSVNPPTIVVMCNIANEIQESYKRYLSNQFRTNLGFDSIPLHIIYRGKSEQNTAHESEDKSFEV